MNESFIRDYQVKLLEDVYNDDMERLKALSFGLEYVLQSIEQEQETDKDIYTYNRLTTCLITIKEIIKEYE